MLGLCSTFVVISFEHFGQIIRTGSLPSRGWESWEHLLILTCLNSDIVDDSRFSNAVDRFVKFKLGRQFDEIFFQFRKRKSHTQFTNNYFSNWFHGIFFNGLKI